MCLFDTSQDKIGRIEEKIVTTKSGKQVKVINRYPDITPEENARRNKLIGDYLWNNCYEAMMMIHSGIDT